MYYIIEIVTRTTPPPKKKKKKKNKWFIITLIRLWITCAIYLTWHNKFESVTEIPKIFLWNLFFVLSRFEIILHRWLFTETVRGIVWRLETVIRYLTLNSFDSWVYRLITLKSSPRPIHFVSSNTRSPSRWLPVYPNRTRDSHWGNTRKLVHDFRTHFLHQNLILLTLTPYS